VAQSSNLAPGTTTVSGGAIPAVGEQTLESTVAGAYAQEEIGFANRFFITGAIRADGASSFGRNFNAEYYPKGSVSWLLSEEPWLPRVPGVSSVRLRAAFGASGVQPGPTDALAAVLLRPSVVDGGTTTGALLSTVGNATLKPERQTEFEGGIDIDLLRQRVHIEATYYYKKSTDALINVPLPTYYGVAAATQEINIGSVRNRGVELAGTMTVIDNRVLGWTLSASGSINQNALLSAPSSLTTPGGLFALGKPIWSLYQQPILSYSDANHDGIIEPNEVTVGTAPVYAGAQYPPAQATYQTTVTLFRHLQLRAQLDSRSGSQLVDNAAEIQTAFGASREVNDRHAPLRDQAAALAYNYSSGTDAGYTYNASFTRLREVSVTYIVPPRWIRPIRARSASVTLAGRNLAIWTRYRGVDPEVNTLPEATGGWAYFDLGAAPPSQYWIARVSVGF
jgi:hypothetical protein